MTATDALLRIAAAITAPPPATRPRIRRPGIRLRIDSAVEPDVRRDVLDCVRWLRVAQPVRHYIDVHIAAVGKIRSTDGKLCEGLILLPMGGPRGRAARTKIINIIVAGEAWRRIQREERRAKGKAARSGAVGGVVGLLLHEWSHYEQFRDGRDLTERGRDARAAGLFYAWRAVHPWRPMRRAA